jgi:hypothetical protein
MDEAAGVHVSEGVGNGREPSPEFSPKDVVRALGAEPVSPVFEVSAGEVLEDGIGTGGTLAGVDDLDDVGMGDGDQGSHFDEEPPAEDGVVADQVRVGDLDDDVVAEPLVAGQEDAGHAAGAERGADRVAAVAESAADDTRFPRHRRAVR